jgi:uncharacterized membrane protein
MNKGSTMKPLISSVILGILCISSAALAVEQGSNPGAVTGGNSKKAHSIIDKKCTTCHSKEKIDQALSSGKDMSKIQKEMEKKGAKLSSNEREVLGIFWKQPKQAIK